MLRQIKSVLVERHIGILVVAILIANAIKVLAERSWPRLLFAITSVYNSHRPPDTFALDFGYPPRLEDVFLIVFGTLFQIIVAAGLFYWLTRQARRSA